jgi:hypothetical protein
LGFEVMIFAFFDKASTTPYFVITESSDFESTFSDFLISEKREILSRWVDSGVRSYIFVHIVDIRGHVVLVITREAVCYFVQFAFDISYVEFETGHVVRPPPLVRRV